MIRVAADRKHANLSLGLALCITSFAAVGATLKSGSDTEATGVPEAASVLGCAPHLQDQQVESVNESGERAFLLPLSTSPVERTSALRAAPEAVETMAYSHAFGAFAWQGVAQFAAALVLPEVPTTLPGSAGNDVTRPARRPTWRAG